MTNIQDSLKEITKNNSNIKYYDSLKEIEDNFDVLLFDMHGVLHSGNPVSNEKKEYLKHLKNSGKKVIVASNDTNLDKKFLDGLSKKGLNIGEHFDFAITSADVFKYMLDTGKIEELIKENSKKNNKKINGKIKIFIMDKVKEPILEALFLNNNNIFEETKILEEADGIVTGTPIINEKRVSTTIKKEYFESVKDVLATIEKIKPLIIVPNPDTKLPGEDGTQTLGAGKFGRMCQKLNFNVLLIGKPSKYFYDYLKEKMKEKNININNNKIAMIGDSFATDVMGGNNAGFVSIAIVNEKSNMGLTLKRHKERFIEKLTHKEFKPAIMIYDII